ncbi:PspA/IM30 family protein [Kaarinaea lacus]
MSSIFSKMLAASKDGAREVGEFNIDTNEIRLYTREIENAKSSLLEVKRELAQIPDKKNQCEREIECLQRDINKLEIDAVAALNNGNNSMMEELVEKIAELDRKIATQKNVKIQYSEHATRLKDLMKKAERTVLEHERELTMVKTTDSVQKFTKSIAQNHRSRETVPLNAKNTLKCIKKRQKSAEHRWAAEESLEKTFSSRLLAEAIQAASTDISDAKRAALQRIRKRAGK